jgi:L-alanine-DL-glutamate epimerase-like enolase superfamily enzyme
LVAVQIERGYVEVPKRPGLGVELNEEAVQRLAMA